MGKFQHLSILVLLFLLAACSLDTSGLSDQGVDKDAIISLICGSEAEESCLSKLCKKPDECAVITALSNQAIFDFVSTYAECQDCDTPKFSPEHGIGQCVEYQVTENLTEWTVTFWVSENCAFRYGNPSDSRIIVTGDFETFEITNINPAVEYLQDPLYCEVDQDCALLSGSGVSVLGCDNYFYAPLNWSGYYPDENCECTANQ